MARACGVCDMARLGKILLVLAFIGYPIVLHAFILKEEVGVSQLLFVFVPLLAAISWMVLRLVGKVLVAARTLIFCGCGLLHRDRQS